MGLVGGLALTEALSIDPGVRVLDLAIRGLGIVNVVTDLVNATLADVAPPAGTFFLPRRSLTLFMKSLPSKEVLEELLDRLFVDDD